MSLRVWRVSLVGAMVLGASFASAQGIVREGAPRLSDRVVEPVCETWRGEIHGNDPSASIVVELCSEGTKVTGTFAWSSRESGADRRALSGDWRDGGATLVARDTAMLESHPLHGWTLCSADGYTLRRVSPDRLEGSYFSERCHDRGRLAMTRLTAIVRAPAAKVAATPPPPVVAQSLVPFASTHVGRAARCSASPGDGRDGGAGAVLCLAAVALCASVRRRRRQSGEACDASA